MFETKIREVFHPMLYPKYQTLEELQGKSLKTIEQWCFEATLRDCNGCLTEVCECLEITLAREEMQGWNSRDLLSSFDLTDVNAAELRESEPPAKDDRSPIGRNMSFLRRAAIVQAIESNKGDREKALKQLEIDDRLCNRFLFQAEATELYCDEQFKDSVEFSPLTAEAFAVAIRDYHPSRDGDWFVPCCPKNGIVFTSVTPEAAKEIVASGVNIQLEWCTEIDAEDAEILSEHRGGLAIGLTSWSADIAKRLARIDGDLHIEDLDLRAGPHQDWEQVVDDSWFTELIAKMIHQGTTDYPFIRYLSGDQRMLFEQLEAQRLAFPSLADTWSEDGYNGEPFPFHMNFQVSQILLYYEHGLTHTAAGNLGNWAGEIVTNATTAEGDVLAEIWKQARGLWLTNWEFEVNEKVFDVLCEVRGILLVTGTTPLSKEIVHKLNARDYLTIIEGLHDGDDELIRSSDRILSYNDGWGTRLPYSVERTQ